MTTDYTTGLDPNDVGANRRPELIEGFEYEIMVTDVVKKTNRGTIHILEYEVTGHVGDNAGASPIGSKSSLVRKEDADGYWKKEWVAVILSVMGINLKDNTAKAQAFPYLNPCIQEAETKVPNPQLPVHLIGRKLIVSIQKGADPKPGKKYYPYKAFRALGL